MPNLVALAALLLWPVVTAVLFRRLGPGRALIVALIAGYLLLPPPPAAINLPLLPSFDKDHIPALSALAAAVALYRPGIALLPQGWLARGLVVLFVFSPVATVLTNPEPMVHGPVVLPGLNWREAVAMVILQAATVTPFLLARHFLNREEDHRDLVGAFMIAGLVYSLPILIEVRLSPQINTWVYGYFQHLFSQMMRDGGFRPIVFLYHALWVAFFTMTAVTAAAAVARHGGRWRAAGWGALGWLGVTLVLEKSYASVFYALVLVPAVLMLPVRTHLRLAALLALVALAYPVARTSGLVPDRQIVALAGQIGPDRAHTLQYRFDNERVLAQHALEKPLFGWGLWGRHHLYDNEDGRVLTVTDGQWVLVLGVLGIVGFVAQFGLLALPAVLAWRRGAMLAGGGGGIWTGPLVLIHGVNMFDLIPNATVTPLTWLVAGAILGLAERAPATGPGRTDARAQAQPPGPPPVRTVL
ncbi:MAG: hypothetical protein IT542_09400 [Rubellimicrobium sp.]|nr:hypothetical protein [Rubellimicrobium sp.]